MKSNLKTMTISLTVLTVLAGAALGIVNFFTADPIAEAQLKAKKEALAAVLPQFDNDPYEQCTTVEGLSVYPAASEGQAVGAAVESFSDNGFGGRVTILFGFDIAGRAKGYSVLSHSETPGLGANMQTWFDDEGTSHNVIGTSVPLKVKADGGEIDAMAGATISSRAFVEALNKARSVFEKFTAQQ